MMGVDLVLAISHLRWNAGVGLVDWGLRGVWLGGIFDEGGIISGSPRADLAVAAPRSLPWFALWRFSDRDDAKCHDVVADARCEVGAFDDGLFAFAWRIYVNPY